MFYGRVEQILKRHGIPLSGWEEIGVRQTRRDGQSTLIPNPGFAGRGWRTYVWNNVPGWGAEDPAKAAALYQGAWSRFVNVIGTRCDGRARRPSCDCRESRRGPAAAGEPMDLHVASATADRVQVVLRPQQQPVSNHRR